MGGAYNQLPQYVKVGFFTFGPPGVMLPTRIQELVMAKKSNHMSINKFWISTGIILVALLILGAILYIFTPIKFVADHLKPNYAEEVAKPIEATLISKGAAKICSHGGNGQEPSNTQPWHDSYFLVPAGKEDAKRALMDAAKENGFTLTNASPENKGGLFVDNAFINDWYFDTANKRSTYKELQEGNIILQANVNASGSEKACPGKSSLTIDDKHSVIGIIVKLPHFKE